MKRLFRVLGALVLLLLLFAAYINFAAPPSYQAAIPVPDVSFTADSSMLARGHSLVVNNCQGCHRSEDGEDLSGRVFDDKEATAQFGLIYTSNITNHSTAGAGAYSDGELYRLLRTGVKRNGELAIAVMPRWALASEEDIHAMIAFLRSDHRLVAPSEVSHPLHHPSFLEKALTKFVFAPTPYQDAYPAPPSLTDPVAYGSYQVNNVNLCYYCHSENIQMVNVLEPRATPGYLAGGFVYQTSDYDVTAPGLLPSTNADLAAWTEGEFIAAIKYGLRPNKPAYLEPMHPYNLLDSAEISAIYAYLVEVDK